MHGEPAAVVPAGKVGGDFRGERAMAYRDAQGTNADPPLHGAGCGFIKTGGGVEAQRAGSVEAEQAIGEAAVPVGMGVERRAEPLHETDGAAA